MAVSKVEQIDVTIRKRDLKASDRYRLCAQTFHINRRYPGQYKVTLKYITNFLPLVPIVDETYFSFGGTDVFIWSMIHFHDGLSIDNGDGGETTLGS